jgi:Zn ribbon nucleic-acid-binding protein
MTQKNLNEDYERFREKFVERQQPITIHCVFCGHVRTQQEVNYNDCFTCGFATGEFDGGVGHHRSNGRTQLPRFRFDGSPL